MTCCRPSEAKRGFATLAAAVLCLALGLMAVALTQAATLDLRASSSSLDRLRTEYRLDGAHRLAAMRLLEMNASGRTVLTLDGEDGPIEVIAEPEMPKLSLAKADQLDPKLWEALGVPDRARLTPAITQLVEDPAEGTLAELDSSAIWQDCAPSMISAFGTADHFTPPAKLSAPTYRFSWRGGEVWRLRLADASGWTDERWVRFTGDARNPAATILRSFRASGPIGHQCDRLLG